MMKCDPTDAAAPFNLGNMLRSNGRRVEAEAALRAAAPPRRCKIMLQPNLRKRTQHHRGWRAALPPGYDRWVSLVRSWGGERWDEKPDGPHELVDELMAIAGDNAPRLGERFDRWEKQWGDAGTKFRRLLKFRDGIKADPLDWPLRPKPATYSDVNGAAFMKAHPGKSWSVSQLAMQKFARERGISIKAMTHLTKTMRDRHPPELEWADIGRSLSHPAGHALPVRKSCSTQMIEKLIDAPDHAMELYALTDAVGTCTVTVIKTLRKNGVVELPDLRRGTLVKLTLAALAKIKRQLPIRDGRGAIRGSADDRSTLRRSSSA